VDTDVAILMADLTGYTAMTQAHGGASAARMVRKYMQLVDDCLVGSARVTQRVGDQVVIISPSASDLLETSSRLITATSGEHEFLSIHAGLHYGTVFMEDDNLFGSTINIASRVMNLASGGQVLCTQAFLDQLPDKTIFKACGSHKLKNVINEFDLFELLPSHTIDFHIDPVCHMQIDPGKSLHQLTIDGATYYFCSEHCFNVFKNSPAAFT
jgi:adenylate cyclase